MLMWCRSAVNFSFFLCLAACRMRASACDTVPRLCARPVLCWFAFPSASALGSTGSAADRSALFVGFPATTAKSDFPTSVRHRLRLLAFPIRTRPATRRWSDVGSPGSRAKSVCTCQCLRPRRAVCALAVSRTSVLPSVSGTTSAPRKRELSRLDGWPVHSPVNASPMPSQASAHDWGRCGSLLLHRDGLAPSTPCRSPGALRFTPESDRIAASRLVTQRALSNPQ